MNKYVADVSPWKTPVTMSKKAESSLVEPTITFVFLENMIKAEMIYLAKPFTSFVCSIFPFYVVSIALGEIWAQKCCFEIFCSRSFDDSADCQNRWGCGAIPSIYIYIYIKRKRERKRGKERYWDE